MKAKTFKLESLRFYGGIHPLAIIGFKSGKGAYTLEGVGALLKQYAGLAEYYELLEIKNKMLEPGEYEDIKEDDFSGQEGMF